MKWFGILCMLFLFMYYSLLTGTLIIQFIHMLCILNNLIGLQIIMLLMWNIKIKLNRKLIIYKCQYIFHGVYMSGKYQKWLMTFHENLFSLYWMTTDTLIINKKVFIIQISTIFYNNQCPKQNYKIIILFNILL